MKHVCRLTLSVATVAVEVPDSQACEVILEAKHGYQASLNDCFSSFKPTTAETQT